MCVREKGEIACERVANYSIFTETRIYGQSEWLLIGIRWARVCARCSLQKLFCEPRPLNLSPSAYACLHNIETFSEI